MKTTIIVGIFISFLFSGLAYSAEKKEYVSPDGRYTALVFAISQSGESKVVVKTKSGRLLCFKSYASEDGEHGLRVEKATWTPDSKFFVYSMSSSGGHQPWRFPAEFCSALRSATRSLDDYVGSIISPDLETKRPDIVIGKRMGKDIDDQANFEVKLSGLEKQGKKQ
jgi:hypothetical protein